MSLAKEIKKSMFAAMKAKRNLEKEVLRTIMGEVTMAAARAEVDEISDDEVQTILRKLIKSNREAIEAQTDAERKNELESEISVVEKFLPRSLGVDEIKEALAEVIEQLKAAPNQGPAMGIAMKTLKAAGHSAEAKDVAQAVGALRSGV